MRSSGRTMVSRTSARMPSLRRRRRGRRVRLALARVGSVVGLEVFVVVIRLSGEVVGAAAFGGTESPAEPGAMCTVGAEEAVADVALLEPSFLLGLPARHANPFVGLRHRSPYEIILPQALF